MQSKTQKDLNRSAKIRLVLLKILAYLFLILLTVLCLFFFYILFVNATKSKSELQGVFKPVFSHYFFQNFKSAMTEKINGNATIFTALWNSLLVATLTSILTVYFSALTAYGVYAYRFKGRKFVATFILAIMMIPSQVASVGFVKIAYQLNLTDQLWLLIVPSIAAPATYFYMLQYLKSTLPLELVEASRMDGSNEFMTFNRIVLPVMKPALAVQMIFSFVASWNNFYMPGLLIHDDNKRTLPIMLALLRSKQQSQVDAGQIWMFIFLSILPVLIVYILLSKSIIKGVTSGSVKG